MLHHWYLLLTPALLALSTTAHALAISDAFASDRQPNETLAAQDQNPAERNAAAAIISGSARPGIIEHQLVRNGRPGKPEITMGYPSFGDKAIDADIRQWVTDIANAFDGSFDDAQDMFSDTGPRPELWASYSVTVPSPKAVSVTFEIWTYTGAVHGNLDIITLNYSNLTSQRLGLVDIFEDPDTALAIMSSWSYKVLSKRLGGLRQEQMLRNGLAIAPENFASLTLTPQGLRINFQPYQVAPWAAGAQRVDIPLDELRPARPLLVLWGKKQ
ncbi:MAG: DUF3298 domain-containing protein [Desulfovibrio sp.]|nr:DUF3298 domain-containing protein [Desulfovibrio sp.]